MNKKPIVPQNIKELKPYVPGKTIEEVQKEYRLEKISKLASNENRLGYSTNVDYAVQQALTTVNNYPDPVARKLRAELAEKYGVKNDQVLLAAGSESLLACLCRTFFLNRENIITADATFIGLYVQAQTRGVKVKRIPLTNDFRFDIKAMVNAIDQQTKMIYIANPNNPTGTYITKKEYEWLMEEIPEDILVVMDEAYFEFANVLEDYPDALNYDYKNVIVLRTFSKAYGLAGFRIGYAIADEKLIGFMTKTKLTFEPTAIAQAAAVAALPDREFLRESQSMAEEAKQNLYTFFTENNVKYTESAANFVMMILPDADSAAYLTQKMLEKGVIVRQLGAFGLPACIRVTVGLEHEMQHFKESYLQIMADHKSEK